MRKVIFATVCAALIGSLSAASAQSMGQPGQYSMKSDNMNANAKMMKKKHMKKGSMSNGGMNNGGMNNGGMNGGMSGGGMNNGGMNNGMSK